MNEEKIDSQTILSVISTFSPFNDLNEQEYDTVSQFLKILKYKKGEIIFNEGDDGKDMFIHFSGKLNAFVIQSDGTSHSLFVINPGDFFGEMSIITHEPRSVSISVIEDAITIKFNEIDFYRVIKEHPVIGFKILKSIGTVQNRWFSESSKSFNDLIRWGETARRRAIMDEMTGLFNRRYLQEFIKDHFSNESMKKRRMSLLMMDLDKIHGINDMYGTKAGDLVITASAQEIRICLRSEDIPARLSGDEFAVLLPDTEKKDAIKIAERIRKNIEANRIKVPASPGSDDTIFIETRTSIGIAVAPYNGQSLEELEETSDSALRKAKELGRNRVEVYK